jgi:hypothetical protein
MPTIRRFDQLLRTMNDQQTDAGDQHRDQNQFPGAALLIRANGKHAKDDQRQHREDREPGKPLGFPGEGPAPFALWILVHELKIKHSQILRGGRCGAAAHQVWAGPPGMLPTGRQVRRTTVPAASRDRVSAAMAARHGWQVSAATNRAKLH